MFRWPIQPAEHLVRARFMEEQGPAIYQLAESAMDEAWAEKIAYTGEPVLVVIEGLTMYLTEENSSGSQYFK